MKLTMYTLCVPTSFMGYSVEEQLVACNEQLRCNSHNEANHSTANSLQLRILTTDIFIHWGHRRPKYWPKDHKCWKLETPRQGRPLLCCAEAIDIVKPSKHVWKQDKHTGYNKEAQGNNTILVYAKRVWNIQLTVCAKLVGTTAKSINKTALFISGLGSLTVLYQCFSLKQLRSQEKHSETSLQPSAGVRTATTTQRGQERSVCETQSSCVVLSPPPS